MTRPSFVRCLLLAAFAALLTQSAAWSAEPDYTIELGKRVGAITKDSNLASLKAAFGNKKVKATDLPGPEGTTLKGAIILEGTDREMHVYWIDDKPEQGVGDIDLIGAAWVVEGVKLGSGLEAVEKANGKPFKVMGFDWDYGGFANFPKGKFDGKVSLRFNPTGPTGEGLSGDIEISSKDAKLRAAKPVVEKISIILR